MNLYLKLGRHEKLEDYDPDVPSNHLIHRPDQDTPLKTKECDERWTALRRKTAKVLDDYIDGPRLDILDENDREPLLTTRQGHVSLSCIREEVHMITCPCVLGGCPRDRREEE